MSKENLKEFCRLVLNDSEIQKHLKNLTDWDEFIFKVVELGANLGFEITGEEVERQMRENRSLWYKRWI